MTTKCPNCGCNHLKVEITQFADVEFGEEDHDVTDGPYGDLEWGDDSTVVCKDCGWCGTLKQCETEGEVK